MHYSGKIGLSANPDVQIIGVKPSGSPLLQSSFDHSTESSSDSSTPSIPQSESPHDDNDRDNVTDESTPVPPPGSPGNIYESPISNRYEYAVSQDGTHGVVHGTRKAFTRCEDEQIHIPGAIQSYGMLVALKRLSNDLFIPRIVSENSHDICRQSPAQLFAMSSFDDIMPIQARASFRSRMRSILLAPQENTQPQEPVVFPFCFTDPATRTLIPCWCAAHYLGADTDLYICEFELQDYSLHPRYRPSTDTLTAKTTTDAHEKSTSDLESDDQHVKSPYSYDGVTEEEEALSSVVGVVSVATKIQKRFGAATTVEDLADGIVSVVKELTRFHRVMVYRFDEEYNGKVISEIVEPGVSTDIYKGLHFPASDIPPQARRLYMLNKVRVLFDRTQETARLVGRDHTDIDVPLDLTYSYLRAMSPVHIKYLGNMGVLSSMSMSIDYEDRLWGLIVCHSYGTAATRVPFSVRELCYFVGVAASTSLQRILHHDKLQTRKIMEPLQRHSDPSQCIPASSEELLALFDADCGFLAVEGEARTIGKLSSYIEAVTIMKYLVLKNSTEIIYSRNVTKDFKDLHYAPGFKAIAGVLFIPLSPTGAADCLVLYRKNQVKEVHWAGRPSSLSGGPEVLEPRSSFRIWTQRVDGSSRAWTTDQGKPIDFVQARFLFLLLLLLFLVVRD